MGNIENISVWKDAIQLAKVIYTLTKNNKHLSQDFGLKDQMQRAVVSIASNIAEGNDRNTDKEYSHFLYISKGSAIELLTQLKISFEIGYITLDEYDKIKSHIQNVHKQLNGFIKHLFNKNKNIG